MARQLTRSAVRIYGALTALGNGSADVMERLLPFFDPLLRERDGQRLDPDDLAKEVRDTYRWNFNTDLVEAFVPHFEASGWVIPDIPRAKDTTYTVKVKNDAVVDEAASTVEGELRAIATQFKEFAESLSPLTTLPMEVEEFEDILVEWLLYVEAFSEKNLDFKTGMKADALGTLRPYVAIPETTSLRDEDQFLCARFVQHALETDKNAAEVLARIASIGLLTEVVQDFVKPVGAVERTDLVVYLDAPVALELLGVSGKAARENTAPIISELIRIGASVRIFGQSIDEIKRILQKTLANPRPTGPTAQALMRREVLKEYVIQVSRDPIELLEKAGVRVAYRTLEQTPSEHDYFTEEHLREFYSALTYTDNPNAREHDADITAFAMRQRHGQTSGDVFRSRCVVLTRNGVLAQIALRKCSEFALLPKGMVPPVIHRRFLATAMWLRTGMGANDLNIPKRMLLASCERVLAIRPGVVEAVMRMTDALGDEEKTRQLDLLVSEDRSAQALMDKTLGASNVITEDNLPILFQEMLHPHLEEERKKGSAAVKKAKAQGRVQLDKVLAERDAAKKEYDDTTAQLDAKMEEDRGVVEALCEDMATRLKKKRRMRIAIAVVIALVSCVPLIFQTSPVAAYIAIFVGWILAYLTLTGGQLVRINFGEKSALAFLRSEASKRRMEKKLDSFDFEWVDNRYVIVAKPSRSSQGSVPSLL